MVRLVVVKNYFKVMFCFVFVCTSRTYSILMDFHPNFAKYVGVVLKDVNTPTDVRMTVLSDVGFHAYFVNQPVTQT